MCWLQSNMRGITVILLLALLSSASAFASGLGLPWPLPYVADGYNRVTISSVGSIDIPNTMRIQPSEMAKPVDQFLDSKGLGHAQFNVDRNIVFMQDGMANYSRIIIMTLYGAPGDFFKLSDQIRFSSSELRELEGFCRSEYQRELAVLGGRILTWYPPQIVNVNGMDSIKLSYRRQIGSSEPAYVEVYYFFNYDRRISLTLSYRESERYLWEIPIQKAIESFRITNIRG